LYQTYSENPQDFQRPLEVNLARIVLKDKETAAKVREELLAGKDFNTLLQRYTVNNEDRFTNGVLGYRSIKDYGFNANALSGLENGELSEVIEYKPTEYHIYKMLGRNESRLLSFDEARDMVDQYLTRRKLTELQKSTIEQVKNKHNAVIKTQKLSELTIQI
jgi:parvulin-like peptidyl-prolyl isomerase